MHKLTVALAGLAVATAAVPAAAATTVFSNDFESGFNDPKGSFSATGNVSVVSGAQFATPPNGFTVNTAQAANNRSAAFGGGNAFNGGTLLATTIAGSAVATLYTIDFDAGRIGTSASEFLSFILTDSNNSSVGDTLIAPGVGTTVVDNVFTHYRYSFTGTGPLSLTFNGGGTLGDNTDVLLDNVLVRAGAVPEASTWAMMIIGFGSVGNVLRRRRASARGAFAHA